MSLPITPRLHHRTAAHVATAVKSTHNNRYTSTAVCRHTIAPHNRTSVLSIRHDLPSASLSHRRLSTTTVKHQSPLEQYDSMIKSNKLRPDPRQVGAMTKLDDLYKCIQSNPRALQPQSFQPAPNITPSSSGGSGGGLFSSVSGWFGGGSKPKEATSSLHVKPVSHAEIANASKVPCKSLYLYGGVGCGKTMLMDLFYQSVDSRHKLRKHFHNFMLDIHKRLHELRTSKGDTADPISVVAADLSTSYRLICLDEFQVTDVADAMVLRRLFSNMFNNGVIVVATSNRVPTDLYKNGINRSEFVPFIDVLQAYCNVYEMTQGSDHRLMGTLSHGVYHHPNNDKTLEKMNTIFKHLIQTENDQPHSKDLKVGFNRTIKVPKCIRSAAMYSFEELCGANYGANDYIALADEFSYVLIHDIPKMGSDRNKVRRFITMLDIFYEQHVRVIFGAETTVDDLFDDSGDSVGDEKFASGRAISRMKEMQSREYFNLCAYQRDGVTGTNTEFDKVLESNTD